MLKKDVAGFCLSNDIKDIPRLPFNGSYLKKSPEFAIHLSRSVYTYTGQILSFKTKHNGCSRMEIRCVEHFRQFIIGENLLRLPIAWLSIHKLPARFFLQTVLFFICGHRLSTETFLSVKWCFDFEIDVGRT